MGEEGFTEEAAIARKRLRGAYPGSAPPDRPWRVDPLHVHLPLTRLSNTHQRTPGRPCLPSVAALRWHKHLFESKQTAAKGTFDHRHRQSKVACCQTREASSNEHLCATELLRPFPEISTGRRESPAVRHHHRKALVWRRRLPRSSLISPSDVWLSP